MNTCDTCEHWEKSWSAGYCNSDKVRDKRRTEDIEDSAPDELVYSYSEGGSFWTGPKFGCVHHKIFIDVNPPTC